MSTPQEKLKPEGVELDDATEQLRVKKGIPRPLVDRLRNQESGGDGSAKSPAGAEGEWQVMPGTFDLYNKKVGGKLDRNKPLDRAYVAFSILADNYKQFKPYAKNESHAWGMALSGYHGSPENVMRDLRRGGMGIPDQGDGLINTRDYVYNIMNGLDLNKPTSMPATMPDVPVSTIQEPKVVKQPKVTSRAIDPSDQQEIPTQQPTPAKPIDFQREQWRAPARGPVDQLMRPFDESQSTSQQQQFAQGRFKLPESVQPGQRVKLAFDPRFNPTPEDVETAYIKSLGPQYEQLNQKHKQETGQNLVSFHPDQLKQIKRDPDGSFSISPRKDAIDYLNAYVTSGGDLTKANQVAEKNRQEQFQAAKTAQEGAKQDIAEVTATQKVRGAESGAGRAFEDPAARFSAGISKALGGVISVGGLLPNQASEYMNRRGRIVELGASLPPLTAQGERIQRDVPEKLATAFGDLGYTVFEIAALKKVSGLSAGQVMALETALKTSDEPVEQRAVKVAENYALGSVLDAHVGRLTSAAIFGVPTAVEGTKEVSQGQKDPYDVLLDTGIQGGIGAILGGGKTEGLTELGIDKAPSDTPTRFADIAQEARTERVRQNVQGAQPTEIAPAPTGTTEAVKLAGVQGRLKALPPPESIPQAAPKGTQAAIEMPQVLGPTKPVEAGSGAGAKLNRWQHVMFGRVTESADQSGVPVGKVRVVDERGDEHVIQRAKGTGAGNQIAIPVREKPIDSRAAEEQARAEEAAPFKVIDRRGQSSESSEKITLAAVRTPDGVETGPNHPSILERAGIKGYGNPDSRNTPMFGFVTDKGRFIEREEAARLATATGQNLKTFESNEPAHSDEIAKPGTKTPISEAKPPERTGIAARVEESRRAALGQPLAESGQGISAEDSVNRGRGLLKDGRDPQEAVDAFQKNKAISADAMALVRARHEELAQAANKAFNEHGIDSPEFKTAEKARADWYEQSVKPMQTVWHKTGMAQQGETAIDTGTFYGLYRAFKDRTGKEMPPQVATEARRVASEVSTADARVQAISRSLTEELDRATGLKDLPTNVQKSIQRLVGDSQREARTQKRQATKQNLDEEAAMIRQNIAAEFQRLRSQQGRTLSMGGLGNLDPEGVITKQIISLAKNRIKAGVTDAAQLIDDVHAALKEFADITKREVAEAISGLRGVAGLKTEVAAKKIDDLRNRLASGEKITPDDARLIWQHAREKYIDRGMDFVEMRRAVATDLGTTPEEVMRAFANQPKVKRLTDEMYKRMSDRRTARNQAEAWVRSADTPMYRKFIKNLPDFFFGLKTFGHGTVGMITHAGKNIFIPSRWADYWPNFARQYRLAYDRGYHERMMTDLEQSPNFITAKRAGLANDPHKLFDDYQRGSLARLFGKVGLVGSRGFDSLKLLRQDLFDSSWNKMPDSLKTPEMAELLSTEINHSTGVTKMQLPKWASTIFFAPSLEGSRWAWMITDNAKALKTLTEWKSATPEEKYHAKMVVSRNAQFVATYAGLLAVNQGLLSATGSKDKINFTDPTKGDWLRFKIGGRAIEPTGGIVSTIDFLGKIAHASLGQKDPRASRFDTIGKATMSYARGKLSPIASTATDVVSQADFVGRPLPFSKDKGTAAKPRYSWPEYLLTQQSPIPFSEAVRDIYHTWQERGLTATDVGKGIGIGILSGFTGVRIGDEYQSPKDKQPQLLDGISQSKYGKPFIKLSTKEQSEVYKEQIRQEIQKAKKGSPGVSQLRRFNMSQPVPSRREGEDATSYQARLLRLGRRVRENLDQVTQGDYWDQPIKTQKLLVTDAVNSAVRAA